MSHSREPIPHTCTAIDLAIANVELAESDAKSVLHYTDMVKSAFEDLRSANQTLREWGCSEADEADNLTNELTDLTTQYESLKEDYEQLKDDYE